MFRNPVYDLMVVVPALLIAGLLGLFVMSGTAHAAPLPAADPVVAATGTPAVTASTSGTTLPDPEQKVLVVSRGSLGVIDETSIAPTTIHTSAELLTYAKQTLSKDRYIESLTLSGKGIMVSYRTQGRLLGLLPLSVPTHATVRADGSIHFSAPWYGTLTLSEKDRMKTALEVRVRTLLNSEGYLPSMQLAPATQAEILDIVRELVG